MICDNCIHNAVCARAHFDNHCGYKHTEADIINPELEKIKNEILSYKKYKDFSCMGTVYDFEIKKVFDNHIKELKGENKKECSTCKSDNSHENCLGCIEYGHWELKGENK